ncbi:LysR substrate-binding domain-containing protein [Variovorax sp. E3]|uniref:LysR substrate-binding domain-containing protein n=1 Tax=Variovorax sp. E3 TaxID=1914993 RepID=UPI0018DDD8E2|nr:LysR substrate-binding domain-containing protein [Variovorax sp. E3]
MLDLQQLHYFVAVAESESIARAAERLHISQSPLSRQVIALEARLGLVLFARTGKRLKLTAAGHRFLGECRQLLSASARLEARVREEVAGGAGTLAVGYVESAIHSGVLRKALRALKRQSPEVEIQLRLSRSAAQFEALRRGEIDVGFTHRAAAPKDELASRLVLQEAYALAVANEHPLASGQRPSAKALDGAPFIFLPRQASPDGRAEMMAACERAGFAPDVRHEAAEPSMALELVAAGLGFAIVQSGLKRIVPSGVSLLALPRGFTLKLEVHVVTRHIASALAGRVLASFPVG